MFLFEQSISYSISLRIKFFPVKQMKYYSVNSSYTKSFLTTEANIKFSWLSGR